MSAGDRTRVTVRVDAHREEAFDVFTLDVDAWWRRGRRYRMRDDSVMSIEPRVGGRFVERAPGRSWDLGEVVLFERPRRLVIAWRAVNFKDADPSTEIEVTFERALGHAGEATLVTIEHRGWSAVRPDHPVRHGQESAAFLRSLGLFWGDLATTLRETIAALLRRASAGGARGSPTTAGRPERAGDPGRSCVERAPAEPAAVHNGRSSRASGRSGTLLRRASAGGARGSPTTAGRREASGRSGTLLPRASAGGARGSPTTAGRPERAAIWDAPASSERRWSPRQSHNARSPGASGRMGHRAV